MVSRTTPPAFQGCPTQRWGSEDHGLVRTVVRKGLDRRDRLLRRALAAAERHAEHGQWQRGDLEAVRLELVLGAPRGEERGQQRLLAAHVVQQLLERRRRVVGVLGARVGRSQCDRGANVHGGGGGGGNREECVHVRSRVRRRASEFTTSNSIIVAASISAVACCVSRVRSPPVYIARFVQRDLKRCVVGPTDVVRNGVGGAHRVRSPSHMAGEMLNGRKKGISMSRARGEKFPPRKL